MKKIAIIDIGSNSIRMIIYKIFHNNAFKAISTEKCPSKLGQHLDNKGNLSPEGINLTINTLKMFKNICEIHKVSDTYVIATEAIRKAKNNKEFLPIIEGKTGFQIKILSGFEEASLGFLSVKSTFNIDNALIVDIGGSSMEISLMKNKKMEAFTSLPLGAIPLTKTFNFQNNTSYEQKKNLENFLLSYFNKIPWLKEGLGFPLIGVSSTPRTIGKIYKEDTNYPLDITHNFKISYDIITSMYNNITPLTLDEKLKIKGLSKEKADIFPAALGAICCLMNYCDSKELIISEFGIKEGLLFKVLNKAEKEFDVLKFSLNNIISYEDLNKDFSGNIFNISKYLYEKLDCKLSDHKILYTSSTLLDIGFNISLENVHKHSFYMILNSNIYGLSHKEILMSAYIVALSKKDTFKLKSKFKKLLSKEDIIFCKKLSIILTLASKFNVLTANILYNISISESKDTIYINWPTDFKNTTFIKETLENTINSNFKKYFNKDISII